MARSRRGSGKVKARSRGGQCKVERKGQGKINIRLKQSNHNHNYNLLGFDTIDINLVVSIIEATQKQTVIGSSKL